MEVSHTEGTEASDMKINENYALLERVNAAEKKRSEAHEQHQLNKH